jgi:transposase InsO family protein
LPGLGPFWSDKPEIFNTDQGSQFTGAAFTGVLADRGITISMDGKGAWRDNVFVERLASLIRRVRSRTGINCGRRGRITGDASIAGLCRQKRPQEPQDPRPVAIAQT